MSAIKPNQKVKLFLDNMDVVLDCTVKSHDNDRILLDFDKSILEYADYLQEGDEVGVKIFTTIGIIVFDSMVLYSPLEKDFIIECVETSPKIQRRDYARVLYNTKIIIEQKSRKIIIARTVDISGGGVKFMVEDSENAEFTPDENVKITLYIPKEPSVTTRAKIIFNPSLPKNIHVLQFTNIDESDRERIIKKTHELQRREYTRAPFDTQIMVERKNGEIISAKTLDLSGGGAKFEPEDVESTYFNQNEELKLTLYMPETQPIHAKAKIVDFPSLPENVHVVQFIDIDKFDRDLIIKRTDKIE